MTDEPGWDGNAEKLRCLMVLDDGIAELLSHRAGQAFFRAFIVEDRASGEMRMKFRWRYKDPDDRSWCQATTDKRGDEAVEFFRSAIEKVLRTAASTLGLSIGVNGIKGFFPPDDGGDCASTLIWLEMRDLIEISVEQVAR
jgi:hypothetical protein